MPERILVADDSRTQAELLRLLLEDASYQVTVVGNGREALRAVEATPPDLIISDIVMPEMDGYSLCQAVKSNRATRVIPLVLLTSLDDPTEKLRALDAGADDFLTKPADRAELLARVRSLLRLKRLYDELQQSRAQLQQQATQLATEKSRAEAILAGMSDGVITIDLQGRITRLNPAAEAILAVPEQAALGRRWQDALALLDPETERPHRPLQQALQASRPLDATELVARRPDGSEVPISLSASPVRGTAGEPSGMVLVFRDVTARKQAERRATVQHLATRVLAEAGEPEEAIRPVLAAIGAGLGWEVGIFWRVDSRARELRCEESWTSAPVETDEFLALSRQLPLAPGTALASRAWSERAPFGSSDLPSAVGSARAAAAARAGLRGTLCVPILADGEVVGVMEFLGREVANASDELLPTVVGVAGQLGRLLERRAAERERLRLASEIERERARLAAVMASMSDGLLVVDAQQRVRLCNARAGELLGVQPADILNRDVGVLRAIVRPRLLAPEDAERAYQEALGRLPERPSFELAVAHPLRRDLLVNLFPLAESLDDPPGFGMLLRDVSAERELARAKDELIGIVSHELRTPLASLVGFAELLLVRDFAEAQRRQYLTVMLEEGRRLAALINDFLDVQRMESGRQQVSLQPTAVRPLLERAVSATEPGPRHTLVLDVPTDLPLVRADADRVQQVLANLLSNALKYSPQGGEVRIAARPAESAVEISVIDQGLGIPPEALPRLFEKFYRVDLPDRRAIKGTGLGLVICRKIVEAHGGRIWAESEGPGKGARVTFTLPVVEPSTYYGDVLVVEDDQNFARLLEAELAVAGLTTTRVESAEVALEYLGIAAPRALVLDLLLPGLQGEEFLRRARFISESRIPVVVVTVKDLDQQEQRALQRSGVVAVFRKAPGVARAASDAVLQALGLGTTPDEAQTP